MSRARKYRESQLTVEDTYIFQRASARQEREYRAADRDDALVALLRLRHNGGIVASLTGGKPLSRARP